MPRIFANAHFYLAALALVGCGAAARSEPQPPPQDVQSEVQSPHHQREIPRLIAPPPAYGNKVVLARR
ncbi:MAG TPA: hypothetical protein VGI10_03995 [Polyangiaceae bacterium]